ncbi:MAG: CDP-alcohol phosphatidyltransferase family protein [Saprospiraceae bacterium]|nr:CDP-alcohol phosphatidyltransferase family protein [Saprospiraceae bacterium]
MTQTSGSILKSRKRENILKKAEFRTIGFLCKIMPSWVTSDMLTFTGLLGSLIVALGLYLGNSNKVFLLLSVFGFMVQWFGDSLDGRLAYYRNKSRKWYGWALDISADWISVCIIGFGFYYYIDYYKFAAFIFIFTYGWSMINSLLRYKINDQYTIDTFSMGPTEVRFIICFFMLLDIFVNQTLLVFAFAGSLVLFIINMIDLLGILKLGDIRDASEKSVNIS